MDAVSPPAVVVTLPRTSGRSDVRGRPRRPQAQSPGHAAGWNDERADLVKRLWLDGLSASQIAQRVGGVTRNAVIGKAFRMRLPSRDDASFKKPKRARQDHKPRVRRSRPSTSQSERLRALYLQPADPVAPYKELEIPPAERKTILTLGDRDCRWPIGDPQDADFHFCGKSKVAGLPYCEFHARRAFRPPQPRSRAQNPSQKITILNGPVSWGSKFSPSMEEV